VTEPDAVLVQDPTLIRGGGVLAGLPPSGLLVVNVRGELPAEVRTTVGPDVRVLTVAASETARRLIGRDAPGPALLGALAAVTGVVGADALVAAVRERFSGHVAEANVDAVLETYHRTLESFPGGARRAAAG
jgi:pyruvate ferredoxin oxidoreductase gamma subunit